jgi:prepilin peptidase CpaA
MLENLHWSNYILFIALAIAVYTDVTKHKIYNWLTFPTLLLGMIFSFFNHIGIFNSLLGFIFAFGIAIFFYVTGMFKGGDVKLIWGIGAWVGKSLILQTLLWIFISGGILGVLYTLRDGTFFATMNKVRKFFVAIFVPGMKPQIEVQETINKPSAYGVAIAIGTVISLLYPNYFGKW